MKKAVRIIAITLGVLLLIGAGLAIFVSAKALPNYEDTIAVKDLTVDVTPERVARGKALVVQTCAGCHRGHQEQFAGQRFEDQAAHETFGEIFVPNITQDPTYGIGRYTDGELYRILRTGVKKNGEPLLPIMPCWPTAAEEDVLSIIAFLRSDDPAVRASQQSHPAYRPSLLAKALLNFVVKPVPYQNVPTERPALNDSLAYGAYLVNDVLGCYHCHSASLEEWNLLDPVQTPGYLEGGTRFYMPEYTVTSPSILPHDTARVAQWTADQFVAAVKFGERPGQPAYRLPMHPYPYLDTTEIRTIHRYLQNLVASR